MTINIIEHLRLRMTCTKLNCWPECHTQIILNVSHHFNLHCRRLAGMCAGVQYHDSFYVFGFGVDPAFRRQVCKSTLQDLKEVAFLFQSRIFCQVHS